MISYTLGLTSDVSSSGGGSVLTLYPDDDYAVESRLDRSIYRTATGVLFDLIGGSYVKVQTSIDGLSAIEALMVTSWWESQAELSLLIQTTSESAVTSSTTYSGLIITGKSAPVPKLHRPYVERARGKLVLESI